MRKLQNGSIPAAGQTDAKPAPEPRREWPRWKRILAVVSLTGGVLAVGACKKSQPNSHMTIEDTNSGGHAGMGAGAILPLVPVPPEVYKAGRFVELAVSAAATKDAEVREMLISMMRSEFAGANFETEHFVGMISTFKGTGVKEIVIDVLEGFRAHRGLAVIAGDKKTGMRLKERIIRILDEQAAVYELAVLATDKDVEPYIRRIAIRALRNALKNPVYRDRTIKALEFFSKVESGNHHLRERLIQLLGSVSAI